MRALTRSLPRSARVRGPPGRSGRGGPGVAGRYAATRPPPDRRHHARDERPRLPGASEFVHPTIKVYSVRFLECRGLDDPRGRQAMLVPEPFTPQALAARVRRRLDSPEPTQRGRRLRWILVSRAWSACRNALSRCPPPDSHSDRIAHGALHEAALPFVDGPDPAPPTVVGIAVGVDLRSRHRLFRMRVVCSPSGEWTGTIRRR